jgi:hypothetical protein
VSGALLIAAASGAFFGLMTLVMALTFGVPGLLAGAFVTVVGFVVAMIVSESIR